MLAGRAEGADAVDAVDRRVRVLRVFKALLPVNAAQIRGQIEIILRKQDADRLDRPAHRLGAPEPLIVQFQHLTLLHGLPQLPQAAQDGLPMVRLDIMELFIADHLLHGAFVFLRYAAVDQLVQNRQHFIPPHGAAFKQNLAHGQNLAVAQAHRLCMRQPVAARRAVLDHVLRQHFIGEE